MALSSHWLSMKAAWSAVRFEMEEHLVEADHVHLGLPKLLDLGATVRVVLIVASCCFATSHVNVWANLGWHELWDVLSDS